MWNKIQYALIYSWVKVHALLPMWALYILSDILYVLVYKVVRYRVKVVRQNMKASFPDKSDTELRRLEREFSLRRLRGRDDQARPHLPRRVTTPGFPEKSRTGRHADGERAHLFYPPDGTLRQLGMVFRLDHSL